MEDLNLTIPFLSAELTTEILSRLPVKSLLKFRSVSKSWLATIANREFIKMHLSLSANNNNKYKEEHDTHHMLILGINEDKWNFKECTLSSLFFDSVTEAFDLDSPIKDATESTYIVCSCNGLIFLVRSSKSSILWNPTIRKYSYFPGFRRRWEKTYARYGFGYDEIHNDYKVVGIFHAGSDSGGDSDDVEIQIYSLKSDVWTNVDGSYRKKRLNGSCLFTTWKLHWNTNTTTNDRIIVSFDLGNEKWETIEKPSYGEGEWDS
ncbi:hypothetical protein T459_24150 [Capsicum annuum]|uniref:F-box domain-containing protein n=1 Tax=Capsicum annuum TaxID=4072 RepID=A0A2G2YUQ2_CAPAN|nr:hypothetical protein T459_24150 [Capsicum annuum]